MKTQWEATLKDLLPHNIGTTEHELLLDTLAELLYNYLSQPDYKSYEQKMLKLQGVSTYEN